MCATRFLPVLAMFIMASIGPEVASAQVAQSELTHVIRSGNEAERADAIMAARSIDPSNMSVGLRLTLVAELIRWNEAYHASLRGFAREDPQARWVEEETWVHGPLTELVASIPDPAVIPALVGALSTGGTVRNALLRFGDVAVLPVIEEIQSPLSPAGQVSGGLLFLRVLVEREGTGTLRPDLVDAMRAATLQRLVGEQPVTALWRAIDLAFVLGDGELRSIVEALARDREEVVARGITDPDLIERTQRLARERLAGVPPTPLPARGGNL